MTADSDHDPVARMTRAILVAEGLGPEGGEAPSDALGAVLRLLYDRLQPLVGNGGFQTLLARATVISARRHPGISRLHIPQRGPPPVPALDEVLDDHPEAAAGQAVELLSELLRFLARIVGWALTLLVIGEQWPDVGSRFDASMFTDSFDSPTSPGGA